MNRYRFISDDDGHWYIIPEDKVQEFYEYIDNIGSYGFAKEPEWIQSCNSPINCYTFTDPKLGYK